MTCASCAARIEKRLNDVDGVTTATVNYATERAAVSFEDDVAVDDLIAEIEATGYTASRPRSSARSGSDDAHAPAEDPDPTASLRIRLIISAVLTVPVVAMATIPALQFDNWQWLSLTLAAPVVVWGALPVPPRRVGQPAPRRGDDGHADLDRHARRVRVVAVRLVLRRRGHGGHEDAVRADHRPRVRRRSDLPGSRRPRSRRSSSPAGTSRSGRSVGPGRR